jgi:hypothetical protein
MRIALLAICIPLTISIGRADLLASSGLYDAATGLFYDVQTVTPANPYDQSLSDSRVLGFDVTGSAASPLIGTLTANSLATNGQLETIVSGAVSGSPSFPLITMYSSAFFLDTLTFHTSAPSGTAYLSITVDGSGTVSESLGSAGVYGRSYGGLLAGEAGTALSWQYPDSTNTSVGTTLLSQPIPFVSGVPVNIEVGLGANLWIRCRTTAGSPNACDSWSGTGTTDFSHTGLLTGIELFDTNGVPIDAFTISSASGTAEPSSLLLCLSSVAVLGILRLLTFRRRHKHIKA